MEMSAYDARSDATRYAANLRRWASSGFVRGLAGMRSEVLPAGAMQLPSEAFHEFATKTMTDDVSVGDERSAREAYLSDVEDMLSEAQQGAIEQHHVLSLWGYLADITISLVSIAVGFVTVLTFGVFHPVTAVFLVATGTAFFMLSFAAKRVVTLSRLVFHAETATFSLPWDDQTK